MSFPSVCCCLSVVFFVVCLFSFLILSEIILALSDAILIEVMGLSKATVMLKIKLIVGINT